MFETASAQALGLFQSPMMRSLERLLVGMGGRLGNFESPIFSRQQSFLNRVFSRHFEAIGLPVSRTIRAPRVLDAAPLSLPASWVPSTRELQTPRAPDGQKPGSPGQPARVSPRPTIAAQRIVPSSPLPMLAPAGLPAMPAQSTLQGNKSEQKAAAVAPHPTTPIAAVPGTQAEGRSFMGQSPERAAPGVASATERGIAGSERAAPVADPMAPSAVSTGEATTAARQVTASSAPAGAAVYELSSAVASTEVGLASSEMPQPGVAAPTSAAAVASNDEPSGLAIAPPEQRVRDWLGLPTTLSLASPALASAPQGPYVQEQAAWQAPSFAVATPTPSGKARSFQHLSWADSQLSRSPWWRAALQPSLGMAQTGPSAGQAMPMLATPDLAPAARRAQVESPQVESRPRTTAPVVSPATSLAQPIRARTNDVAAPAAIRTIAERPMLDLDGSLAAAPARAAVSTEAAELTPAAPLPAQESAPQPEATASFAAPTEAVATAARPGVAPTAPASVSLRAPTSAVASYTSALREQAPELGQALRFDPGLVPQQATPELLQTLTERVSPVAGIAAPSISWAQPGGIWSQPVWSPAGLFTRMALGSVVSQASAWQASPGLPSVVSRSLARAEDAPIASKPASRLQSLPWVAPVQAVRVTPESGAAGRQTAVQSPLATVPSRALRSLAPPTSGEPVPPSSTLPLLAAPAPRAAPQTSPVLSANEMQSSPTSLGAGVPNPHASPPQPWRELGGLGAMAELFAAGIGMSSGAAAAQAQLTTGAQVPSLFADWLRPVLSPPAARVSTEALTSAGVAGGLPLPWLPAPAGREQAGAPAALPSPRPAAVAAPSSLPGAPAAPSVVRLPMSATPSQASPVGGVADHTPSFVVPALPLDLPTPARPEAVLSSLFSVTQPGGLGVLAQRFAGDHSLRSVSPGLPLRTEAGAWATAPGVPLGLAESLSLLGAQTLAGPTERAVSLFGQAAGPSERAASPALRAVSPSLRAAHLPYLSVLPPADAERRRVSPSVGVVPERSSASARAMVAPSSQSAMPSVTAQPAALPALGGQASVRAAVPASEERTPSVAPWFAPGGGGTLAELFAAGIATTSGVTAWLSQMAGDPRSAVVPPWVGSLLSSLPGPSPSPLAIPRRAELAAGLPFVPAARAGGTPATESLRQPSRPTPATQQPSAVTAPRVGAGAVRAEQFASQQGLVSAASEPGRWVPIAGGLTWLTGPDPVAKRSPAATVDRSVSGSPLQLGGLALHSELFASAEQARTQDAGERLLHSVGRPAAASAEASSSDIPSASAGRWSGAGGLIYLPPAQKATSRPSLLPTPRVALTSAQATRHSDSPWAPRVGASAQAAHVSVLGLAQPWNALPRELERLGLPSLSLPRPSLAPTVNKQSSPLKGAIPRASASQPVEAPASPIRAPLPFVPAAVAAARATQAGSAPVLAGASLRMTSPTAARSVSAPTPAMASSRPYELASRYAASMLTAFPQAASAEPRSAQGEQAKPAMLWPQAASTTAERIARIFAMLPSVPPSTGPQAALAELVKKVQPGSGLGMPLWQRLPSQLALSVVEGGRPRVAAQGAAEDGAESDQGPAAPSLTLLDGDRPAAKRGSRGDVETGMPATKPAAPPPVEVFKAALTASGISREQVEASAKLMQAITGSSSGQGGRGDDRLSLDDLTLVAISMGQGRMAASQGSALTSIPSVESALRLPNAQHPTVTQDDREVRKKIDHMAESVVKMLKQMKDNQGVRGGFDM